MDDVDPRAAKLLGDLLALTLDDNEPQAQAALAAIRRRAKADALTGGALKRLVELVLGRTAPVARDELARLQMIVEDQRRELAESRQARQRAEMALSRTTYTATTLQDMLEGEAIGRRQNGLIGFVLGAAAVAFIGVMLWTLAGRVGLGTPEVAATPGEAQLDDFLHECFLNNTNSLMGGLPIPLDLVIDVDAQGDVVNAAMSESQQSHLFNPARRRYADMMLRTLNSGSCGVLPLPPSWHGHAGELDLHLPR